jgi:hypothetical protein
MWRQPLKKAGNVAPETACMNTADKAGKGHSLYGGTCARVVSLMTVLLQAAVSDQEQIRWCRRVNRAQPTGQIKVPSVLTVGDGTTEVLTSCLRLIIFTSTTPHEAHRSVHRNANVAERGIADMVRQTDRTMMTLGEGEVAGVEEPFPATTVLIASKQSTACYRKLDAGQTNAR